MRKLITLILALVLMATACVVLPAASVAEPLPMYVYTENGKTLNVRSGPSKADKIIGQLKYGEKVDVEFINSTGWAVIFYKGEEAYVQGRFLVDNKPAAKPTVSPEKKEEEELKAEQKKLNSELASEKEVDPFYIAVRATRSTGWINYRVGPSKITTRIASFPDGKELIVAGQTNNWYRAKDPETGKTGYIFKKYTVKLNKQVPAANPNTADGKQKLGSLTVHGEFELTCNLPEGYNLQVVNMQGTRIVASVLSEDMTRPQLYLSIDYDEAYGDVNRLNDLTDQDLALLEQSFTEMNQVDISYRQTGHGTKLLIARETGSDTDFVDILTIYKGYFIEFNMTPNPNAATHDLTEEQIGMCVDFLTDLDFNAINS